MSLDLEGISDRIFLQLLQTCIKKIFFKKDNNNNNSNDDDDDEIITNEYIHETFFLTIDNDKEISSSIEQINILETILVKAAYENWDILTIEKFLASSTKLIQDHIDIFSTLWKTERPKIHDILCKKSTFDGKLLKNGLEN